MNSTSSKKYRKPSHKRTYRGLESPRTRKMSPPKKSIIPSKSYAKNIGFVKVNSPSLEKEDSLANKEKFSRTPNKTNQKGNNRYEEQVRTNKSHKINNEDQVRKKQADDNISESNLTNEAANKLSKIELPKTKVINNSLKKVTSHHSNKRLKLQARYKQNNAMSHTPNPKLAYNPNLHSKRKSQTPEPKAGSHLIGKHNKGALITEPLTDRKYCLVLDLDETLIHFKNDNGRAKFLIRPYTYNFLRNLRPHYELIIFTAAQKEYADWILDKIDSKGLITHRFYRNHCIMSRVCHLKDISLLNRDLNLTLIVDNFQENFSLQKENGVHIKGWYGDTKDTVLEGLEEMLLNMANQDSNDVKKFLKESLGAGQYNGLSLFS